ncbi:coiled-coil domain-containing protein [Candidatus Cytomitobacter primus]|uniref:Uncharacterized protein n=1 Tax=Candidatus Cytomitobacter primus TaxID=2066024 RepID=A0A5C0UFQ5_9PROT|nr:hypothetical protein [Candidatus Cytomitobacter primus]QEK38629.1 hypothetical protein FZC34_01765 [Candidatus Cytomitobacter primus]
MLKKFIIMLLITSESYAMENEEMDMMDEMPYSELDKYSEHTVNEGSEHLNVSKSPQLDSQITVKILDNDQIYYRSQIKEDRADDFAHITYMQRSELALLRKMENSKLKLQLHDEDKINELQNEVANLKEDRGNDRESIKSLLSKLQNKEEKSEQLKLELQNRQNEFNYQITKLQNEAAILQNSKNDGQKNIDKL